MGHRCIPFDFLCCLLLVWPVLKEECMKSTVVKMIVKISLLVVLAILEPLDYMLFHKTHCAKHCMVAMTSH